MAKESFLDSVKHFVGVEDARTKRKHDARAHFEKSEEAALEAAYNAYLMARDGLAVAGDVAGEQLSKAGHYSAEQLSKAGHFSAEQLARFADYSKRKAAEGLEIGKEKAAEGFEIGKEKAAEGLEIGKEKLGEGFEYSKEKLGEGYEYSKEKAAEGLEYTYDAASQRAAEALRISKEKAAEGYDFTAQKAAEGYDAAAEMAKDAAAKGYDATKENLAYAHRKIMETVSELPENAGHSVVRFRDEAGSLWERIKSESGDYYERYVEEPALESTDSAKGVFGKLGDGLSHLGHNINSMFHSGNAQGRKLAEDAAQGAESQYEYVKDSVGDYVLKAKHAAQDASGKAQGTWDDLFSSKDWQSYFKRNPKFDEKWWRSYFESSNFSPSAPNWREYIDSFVGGPSKLDQFWRKAEKKGYAARDNVRGKYHQMTPSKRSSWFGSSAQLSSDSQPWFGIGDSEKRASGSAAAPVGLFWSAILALYLLFLAKRIFEQKREQVARTSGPSPTPSSVGGKDVGYSEKVNLSHVAQASAESLSTFAIYAPATTVLLLAHELNGAVRPLVLHLIYTALFAGQFLQNETSLVHDVKARGLGVYLSWGAAGVAGVAGVLVSLRQVL